MFSIDITGCGSIIVAVRGELDTLHAPTLRSAITGLLNRGNVTAIKLDVTAVTSVDSIGLGTIVVAHRIAAALGVELRLIGPSPVAALSPALLGVAPASSSRTAVTAGGRLQTAGRGTS